MKNRKTKVAVYLIFGVWLLSFMTYTIFFGPSPKKVEEKLSPEVEKQNLDGICMKTGTNLMTTLGRQRFYELVLKKQLEYYKQRAFEHETEHWEICAKRNCGLYYLSADDKSLQQLFDDYEKHFFETATYSSAEHGMVNDPFEVFTKQMALKKLTKLDSAESFNGGFFYLQKFNDGWIKYLPKNAKGVLLTLDEVKSLGKTGATEEQRKRGIGNFFVRYSSIMVENGGEPVYTFGKLKVWPELFWPISNCGEVSSQ